MLLRLAPFIFVLIWSGAFVAARGGLPDFTPWAILTCRFFVAAMLLAALALLIKENEPDWRAYKERWVGVVGAGILMNGLYLGLFFTAMLELPAANVALIGSLTPLLTAALSGPILGEHFKPSQWVGFVLGIIGVSFVVGIDYITVSWRGVVNSRHALARPCSSRATFVGYKFLADGCLCSLLFFYNAGGRRA
ncbi:MAG: DMT family transporter [Rhodospirillales bacterium]